MLDGGGSYLKMGINKKKKIQIVIVGLLAIGTIFLVIVGNTYSRNKTAFEQQLEESDPDVIRHRKELAIKEMILDYTDEYAKNVSVWISPEDKSEKLNIEALIVYNTEVPESIKESLVTAISNEFSIDESIINLTYVDYGEIKKP